MRRIGQSSAQMAGLVEDLLLLARLDEGRPLDRTCVDLVPLVHEAVLDASATNPSREIRVDCDQPVTTEGDRTALRQIIVNLITNCLRHTPPSASVEVQIAQLPGWALLEVTDSRSGHGRPKRHPCLRPIQARGNESDPVRYRAWPSHRGRHRCRPWRPGYARFRSWSRHLRSSSNSLSWLIRKMHSQPSCDLDLSARSTVQHGFMVGRPLSRAAAPIGAGFSLGRGHRGPDQSLRSPFGGRRDRPGHPQRDAIRLRWP